MEYSNLSNKKYTFFTLVFEFSTSILTIEKCMNGEVSLITS